MSLTYPVEDFDLFKVVLILVLMEDTLGDHVRNESINLLKSLNPCSNGILSDSKGIVTKGNVIMS